jgi:3D (Asp-Asp-Asp) domain-containing protein
LIAGRAHWIPFVVISLLLAAGVVASWTASDAEPGRAPVEGTLCADGKAVVLLTQAETVGDLLADLEIELGPHDRCVPPLEAPLVDGIQIEVTRVSVETVERERVITPPVIARYDRRVGRTIVLHPGSPGKVRERVRIWRKDGQVTSEELLDRQVLAKTVPTRVVRGPQSLASRGSVRARWSLTMVATAYDPGPGSCGRFASGYTAVGMKAGKGVVAVDPRLIPLGSTVYIEGYGSGVAGDVGSAIKGRRIDLGFDTRAEALQWGRRRVTVYVLE